MATYEVKIVGEVPIIAWIKDGILFCNSPNGYVLYKHYADGSYTVIDSEDKPTHKEVNFKLEKGERLEIEGNPLS